MVGEGADGVRLVFHTVVFAELFDRLFDDDVAGKPLHVPLHGAVVREEAEVVGQAVYLRIRLGVARQAYALEHFADIRLLLGKGEQLREFAPFGEQLFPALAVVLFQQAHGGVQVRELFFKMHQPQLLDALVRLVVIAAPVQVALGVFVHDHALEHVGGGIGEGAVAGDVLFFDHGDLGIQLSAQLRIMQVGDVEVIVHRLLFGGGDDGDVQAGDGVAAVVVDIEADVVLRGARLGDGGAAGHDLGIAPYQLFGVDAALEVQQVGIAVQVVEIFQQGEVHLVLDVRVLFPLGEDGGEVYRQLFVADGML